MAIARAAGAVFLGAPTGKLVSSLGANWSDMLTPIKGGLVHLGDKREERDWGNNLRHDQDANDLKSG